MACVTADTELTEEAIRSSFEIVLTTNDNALRVKANQWLSQVFRSNYKAWDYCIYLVRSCSSQKLQEKDAVIASELRLFGAQILYQKVNDVDLGQIISNREKCMSLCQFLMEECFNPAQARVVDKTRLRLCDTLAACIVSFLELHWLSAMTDVITAGCQTADRIPDKLDNEELCMKKLCLLHTLALIPELTVGLDQKRHLMGWIGYEGYRPWKKTKTGTSVIMQTRTVGNVVGEALRAALVGLSDRLAGLSEDSLYLLIREACQVVKEWSRHFDCAMLAVADIFSQDRLLLAELLLLKDKRLFTSPLIAEMFDASILRLTFPGALASASQGRRNSGSKGNDDGVVLHHLSLEWDQLGIARIVVEPVFVFLNERIWALQERLKLRALSEFPSSSGLFPSTVTPLPLIECEGGGELLSYMLQWTSVIYNLAVSGLRNLFLRQSSALIPSYPGAAPIAPRLLIRLFQSVGAFHPHTHLRLLDFWGDVTDLRNDELLEAADIELLLSELFESTLITILCHARRDNPVWNEVSESPLTDADGRAGYLESCQDAIVAMYYLFLRLGETQTKVLVERLLDFYEKYCTSNDAPGSAVCIMLLESVIETAADPSSTADGFAHAICCICEKVPLDHECVVLIARLVRRQAAFLIDKTQAQMWQSLFQSLMRVFAVEPRLCTAGLYELCESGGHLAFQAGVEPLELIQNIYGFVETQSRNFSEETQTFEGALFGALVALARRLSAPLEPLEVLLQLFSGSRAAIEQCYATYKAEAPEALGVDILKLLVREVHRLCCGIAAMESKQATNAREPASKELRQAFVNQFLVGANGNEGFYKAYFYGIDALLYKAPCDSQLHLRLATADCYEARKASLYLWGSKVTWEAVHHWVIHFFRQLVRSVRTDQCASFWKDLVPLFQKHLGYSLDDDRGVYNASLFDSSLYWVLGDILRRFIAESAEFGFSSGYGASPQNPTATLTVMLKFAETTAVSAFLMTATSIPASLWGTVLKPCFSFLDALTHYWETTLSWDGSTLRQLVPLLIRGLESPSHKIQMALWDVLVRLLQTNAVVVTDVMWEFYGDMVRAFWWHCHLWDLQRITKAVSFVNALLRPVGHTTDGISFFIEASRALWANRTEVSEPGAGLLHQLSETEMDVTLNLFQVLRGLRVRQLLTDLIKIGKRLAGSDCLLSYQFLLEEKQYKTKRASVESVIQLD